MTQPKFSVITDLYSISQLQMALIEAAGLAQMARATASHYRPSDELDALDSALDALATSAQAAAKELAKHELRFKGADPQYSGGSHG